MYAVGLEKAVLPVPLSKIKVLTTFIKVMNSEHPKERKKAMKLALPVEYIGGNKVAVLTVFLDVPRNKRVLGAKLVVRVNFDHTFKARLVLLD